MPSLLPFTPSPVAIKPEFLRWLLFHSPSETMPSVAPVGYLYGIACPEGVSAGMSIVCRGLNLSITGEPAAIFSQFLAHARADAEQRTGKKFPAPTLEQVRQCPPLGIPTSVTQAHINEQRTIVFDVPIRCTRDGSGVRLQFDIEAAASWEAYYA